MKITVIAVCGFAIFNLVLCQRVGDLRLQYGPNHYSGQLQIYISGRWGSICDDAWNEEETRVACRQMGFSGYASFSPRSTYSRTHYLSFWLDNVFCTGSEPRILDCNSNGYGNHDCNQGEHIGIICKPSEGDIQLKYGSNRYQGQVQIYHDGSWGAICDNRWGPAETEVACRQLGSPGAVSYRLGSPYTTSSIQIWLDNVLCTGAEARITDCAANAYGVEYCNNMRQHVGIVCQNPPSDGDIRLQHGRDKYSGQVQIYKSESWWSICDDGWGTEETDVACRQLGYLGVSSTHGSPYSRSYMRFWFDDVACNGTESRISDCNATLNYDCDERSEHIGIICHATSIDGDVRLQHGRDQFSGQVQIYHAGRWSSICRGNFDHADAVDMCRQLGLPTQLARFWFGHVIENYNSSWLGAVHCTGTERSLANCGHSSWSFHNCLQSDVINLRCSYPPTLLNEGDIVLYATDVDSSGEIVMLHNNTLGYVCFESFTYWDAVVICRQLHFSTENPTWTVTAAPDDNPIHVDAFKCTGHEDGFMGCRFNTWGSPNCRRDRIVSLNCHPPMDGTVKLINGPGPWAGRLRLFHQNRWGAVCDDDFDNNDARVVCRQLGFDTDYARAICCSSSVYSDRDDASATINANYFRCGGLENSLTNCRHQESIRADCGRDELVSISCRVKYGTLRLQNGPGPNIGCLEIYHRDRWGGVCMTNFDTTDATVACTQMGYMPTDSSASPFTPSLYGSLAASSFVWLSDVACYGGERQLAYCHHAGWGSGSCPRNQYVSLHCQIPQTGDIRVTNGQGRWQGKLQHFEDNSWRAVCGINFGTAEAQVACRQLGFPAPGAQHGCCSRPEFGGTNTMELTHYAFRCSGSEANFADCTSVALPSSCGINDKVDITCDHDPCLSSPCYHGSRCTRTPGSSNFVCACTHGWMGQRCRTLSPLSPYP